MNKKVVPLELSEGWISIKLSEITLPIMRTNKTYEESNEEFKYIDIEAIDNNTQTIKELKTYTWGTAPSRAQQIIQNDDILFATVRPYLKNIAIASSHHNQAIASSGFCILRTIIVNPKFVFYYVSSQTFIDSVNQFAKGTSYPAVTSKIILDQNIPLTSLNEQKKIVSKIDELFSELDMAEATLQKIKKHIEIYRHSLLKSAFNGTLTQKWRTENSKESVKDLIKKINLFKENLFKTRTDLWAKNSIDNKKPKSLEATSDIVMNDLPTIPQQWVWVNLGNISNIIRGASPRPAGDSRYFGGNIPWITVGELTKDEKVYLTSVSSYVTELGRDHSRFIEKETLLLTNSGATLGVPKITHIDGCINDGSVALLDIYDSNLQLYLYWFLKSKTVELRKNSQGAGQPNLNTDIVKGIPIPLPSLNEQIQIVQEIEYRYTIIDNLSNIIRSTLLMIEGTRSSILNKAFKGKLVEQNTLDQTAVELLKQIAIEKTDYLKEQKRLNENKPKKLKNMEDKKTILEILTAANTSMTAKEVWIQSKHKDDIEAFYSELRDISDKIIEIKKDTESLLSLRYEN